MRLRPLLSNLFELANRLIRRYPGTVALFGFISGVASFVLVERHAGLAKVIAFIMLISWLWLVLESSLRRSLQRWFGWQVPPPLLRYATQMVHQESLFFIIPFFAITTTWNSGQALFTGLLGAAALVSLIDPLYYRWLAPRRWVYLGFHALTLFAVLLTALPIILHLSTPQSYQLALAVAVYLSAPAGSQTTRPAAETATAPAASIAQPAELIQLALKARKLKSVYIKGRVLITSSPEQKLPPHLREAAFEIWARPPVVKTSLDVPSRQVRVCDGQYVYTYWLQDGKTPRGRRRKVTAANFYDAIDLGAVAADALICLQADPQTSHSQKCHNPV